MTDILKNSGLIVALPHENDYVAGTTSPLKPEFKTWDWVPYLPSEERQSSKVFDALACVSFSALNCLEAQLNWYLANNKLPETTKRFLYENGYIVDEKVNLSDRFLAKASGTTKNGNYLQKVADTLRHFGAVPEHLWAWDKETFDWNAYYGEIPGEVKEQGLRFLEHFDISYQWLFGAGYDDYLQYAPIQTALYTCPGWNNPPVEWCGATTSNHAVMKYDNYTIFDTYEPFNKVLSGAYEIPWRMQIIITPKKLTFMKLVIKGTEQYLEDSAGRHWHIYNAASLTALLDAGVINTLTPTPVETINDTGKEFVVLVRE